MATIFVRALIPDYLVTHGVVVGPPRAASSPRDGGRSGRPGALARRPRPSRAPGNVLVVGASRRNLRESTARAYQTAEVIAATQLDPRCASYDDVAEYDRLSGHYVPVEELKAENDSRYHTVISGQWDTEEETSDEFRVRVGERDRRI